MIQVPVYRIDEFIGDKKQELFYVNKFSKHLESHGFIKQTHGHNFYLTVLFTQGTGTHEIDFEKYDIRRGSLFTIKPGQVHNWEFSDDIDGYIFFHSAGLLETQFREQSALYKAAFFLNRKNAIINLDKSNLPTIIPLFESLITEFNRDQKLKAEKLGALVYLIYLELSQISTESGNHESINPHYLNKVHELELLIDSNYRTMKLPSQYAELMNMTPKHLNRIAKAILDSTATNLIMQRVVLEAKRLLVSPKFSIAQVAGKLGYDDTSYFTKVFKKSTDMSPKNFRFSNGYTSEYLKGKV